jgi:hypothetical protein
MKCKIGSDSLVKIVNNFLLSTFKVPGIESEDEDNSDDEESSKKVSMVASMTMVCEQTIKTESPEASSSNNYAPLRQQRDRSQETAAA